MSPWLQAEQYDVVLAENGKEAVDKFLDKSKTPLFGESTPPAAIRRLGPMRGQLPLESDAMLVQLGKRL